MKINVGLSLAFFNRELTSDNKQDYSTSFKASAVSIDELAAHILEGRAWTPATFNKLRRKSDFIQAQIVALDCDDNVSVAKAMLNPAIANYAAIIHATPSSTPDAPRSRIIFVLDSAVTEVDRWELLQRVLIFRFAELKPDRVAKDAARYFYGCRDAECHINSSAVLPVAALEKYIPDMVATENKQLELAPGSSAAPAIDRAVSYADATFRNSLIELQAAPSGERNATLNKIAFGLFSKARSGEWPGITESTVQAELYQQGLSIGLEKHEVTATIRSAQNSARPQPLILTDKPLLSPSVNGGGLYVQTTNQAQQPLPVAPPDIKIISHEESWSSFLDTLRVGYSSGEVLSIPMENFHPMDGYCKYIPARKIIGIVAPSSHGKTSFIETWIDRWLQMGISGLLYGPEWTPVEVWQRRAQRHTGLSYTRMLEFEAYKADLKKDISPGQCRGSALTEEERAKAEEFKQWKAELKGRLHCIDAPNKTIKAILAGLTEKLKIMRDEGQVIGYAVFDYAQIMTVSREDVVSGNEYETAVGMVKSWGEENNIVSIIGSQVTKESSRRRGIGGNDAHFLRPDKMNLMITLNIEKLNPDDPEDDRLSNRAAARVVKNSMGDRGTIPLWTDFKHLTWLQEAPKDPFNWGGKK